MSLINMLSQKIAYLTSKHNMIASNIANANTAGYTTKYMTPFNAHLLQSSPKVSSPLQTTSPNHINSRSSNKSNYKIYTNGTPVNIEQQSVDLQANSLEHRKAIEMYIKASSLLRTAIGNGAQ